MIRLYHWPRSSATRVQWALEELGVPYESVLLDAAKKEHRQAAYLAVNPNGKVPALVDGDCTLFESVAILLHLADRHGVEKALWPKAGPDRATATSWTVWSIVELHAYGRQYVYHGLDSPVSYGPADRSAAAAEYCLGHHRRMLDMLEARLEGREHVMGGFSLVDVPIASTLAFLSSLGVAEIRARPRLAAYLESCTGRPAFGRAR
jgi:glutathione S-transferase